MKKVMSKIDNAMSESFDEIINDVEGHNFTVEGFKYFNAEVGEFISKLYLKSLERSEINENPNIEPKDIQESLEYLKKEVHTSKSTNLYSFFIVAWGAVIGAAIAKFLDTDYLFGGLLLIITYILSVYFSKAYKSYIQ